MSFGPCEVGEVCSVIARHTHVSSDPQRAVRIAGDRLYKLVSQSLLARETCHAFVLVAYEASALRADPDCSAPIAVNAIHDVCNLKFSQAELLQCLAGEMK